jgi:hypothetical protein
LPGGSREVGCGVDGVEVQQVQVAAFVGDFAGGGGAFDAQHPRPAAAVVDVVERRRGELLQVASAAGPSAGDEQVTGERGRPCGRGEQDGAFGRFGHQHQLDPRDVGGWGRRGCHQLRGTRCHTPPTDRR